MNGDDFRLLREQVGRSQGELKDILNARLKRAYDKSRISRWENGREAIPADVAAEMSALSIQGGKKKPRSSRWPTTKVELAKRLARSTLRARLPERDTGFCLSILIRRPQRPAGFSVLEPSTSTRWGEA